MSVYHFFLSIYVHAFIRLIVIAIVIFIILFRFGIYRRIKLPFQMLYKYIMRILTWSVDIHILFSSSSYRLKLFSYQPLLISLPNHANFPIRLFRNPISTVCFLSPLSLAFHPSFLGVSLSLLLRRPWGVSPLSLCQAPWLDSPALSPYLSASLPVMLLTLIWGSSLRISLVVPFFPSSQRSWFVVAWCRSGFKPHLVSFSGLLVSYVYWSPLFSLREIISVKVSLFGGVFFHIRFSWLFIFPAAESFRNSPKFLSLVHFLLHFFFAFIPSLWYDLPFCIIFFFSEPLLLPCHFPYSSRLTFPPFLS